MEFSNATDEFFIACLLQFAKRQRRRFLDKQDAIIITKYVFIYVYVSDKSDKVHHSEKKKGRKRMRRRLFKDAT